MTDPNIPPSDRPVEPVHHTTINNNAPAERSRGGFLPLLVIGLLVVLAVVAWLLFSNGAMGDRDTDVDVNIDVPAPSLPDAPKMPDLPQIEPPSLPTPSPAPSN